MTQSIALHAGDPIILVGVFKDDKQRYAARLRMAGFVPCARATPEALRAKIVITGGKGISVEVSRWLNSKAATGLMVASEAHFLQTLLYHDAALRRSPTPAAVDLTQSPEMIATLQAWSPPPRPYDCAL